MLFVCSSRAVMIPCWRRYDGLFVLVLCFLPFWCSGVLPVLVCSSGALRVLFGCSSFAFVCAIRMLVVCSSGALHVLIVRLFFQSSAPVWLSSEALPVLPSEALRVLFGCSPCAPGSLRVLWCSSCALVFFGCPSCAVLLVCCSAALVALFWWCSGDLFPSSRCALGVSGALGVLFVCSSCALLLVF